MRAVAGPAWVLALLLFGCAAASQPEAASCPSTSMGKMVASMQQSGIDPELAVSGPQLDKLRALVTEHSENPVPIADKALIYVDPSRLRAVIIWFYQNCLSGYIQGPWPPVAEAIGAKP